ncbi:MAG: Sugar phosphate permease [Chloroflexi bacterium]|jgi:sugar phosphate permease|nr:MAG: Sugar phosphate permease [Chloroflexota bacterium]
MKESGENIETAGWRNLHYGWVMVANGAIVNAIGSVHAATFPIFFLPIQQEFKVGSAAVAFVLTMARVQGGIEGPLVGWFIDRVGPRIPAVLAALIGGIGFLILPMANTYWSFVFIYVLVISFAFNMGFLHAMHAVANLWFVRYRTRVLSIYSSSLRFGSALLTPVVAAIVLKNGWRGGATFAGVLVLVAALPLTFLIRKTPESMGLLPDWEKPGSDDTAASEQTQQKLDRPKSPEDFETGQALRSVSYWLIMYSTAVRHAVLAGVRVHFIPIFVGLGFSEITGASFLALTSFIATPLILFNGWLGDRVYKPYVLMTGQVASVIGMLFLMNAGSAWTLYLFTFFFAYGESTAPVNHSIIGDFYGRKNFAKLNGMLGAGVMFGSTLTPVAAGLVVDNLGTYTPALWGFMAAAAVAAVLMMMCRRPEKPAKFVAKPY